MPEWTVFIARFGLIFVAIFYLICGVVVWAVYEKRSKDKYDMETIDLLEFPEEFRQHYRLLYFLIMVLFWMPFTLKVLLEKDEEKSDIEIKMENREEELKMIKETKAFRKEYWDRVEKAKQVMQKRNEK